MKQLEQNFDVSVILPFYKKMEEFRKALPMNAFYFQRNGIEVIICLDEDSEEIELLNFISTYSLINWKVIVNHQKHEWRNPSKAINVGIKHANKKYVLVCSPESIFYTDAIKIMREYLEYYDWHFAVGRVAFVDYDRKEIDDFLFSYPFGSIMVKKDYLVAIGGYDESLDKWGGDDNNVRARLELSGVKKLYLPEVKLVHREEKEELKARKKKTERVPIKIWKDIFLPSKRKVNADWGKDFDDVVFNWRHKRETVFLLNEYLQSDYFLDLEMWPQKVEHTFKSLLLVQSYNEEKQIVAFLENASAYFDGIVLLDDESMDDTYKLAKHPSLVLKVKKKRCRFNDLENRNILLDIASFFNTEWLAFMDVDERIDARYADFSFMNDKKVEVAIFRLVHLWNDENVYNADYPCSKDGIQQKYRMFRNKGRMQIVTDKKCLHFQLTPYYEGIFVTKILLLHYGNMRKEERLRKYRLYSVEDVEKDQHSYEHLVCSNPCLKEVEKIII